MKLHQLLAVMRPGDRARGGPEDSDVVVMSEHRAVFWETGTQDHLKVSEGSMHVDWQLERIPQPLPIGEWIEARDGVLGRVLDGSMVWVSYAEKKVVALREWSPQALPAGQVKRIYILPDPAAE